MYLNRDAATKKMKRANEERCRMKRANEDQEDTDERRKMPFFEYNLWYNNFSAFHI